jgi:hypothetical protein
MVVIGLTSISSWSARLLDIEGHPHSVRDEGLGTQATHHFTTSRRLFWPQLLPLSISLLMYTARVRAGFVPTTRRELFAQLKPFVLEKCQFANLPESKSGRWGQGLTAVKMRVCV